MDLKKINIVKDKKENKDNYNTLSAVKKNRKIGSGSSNKDMEKDAIANFENISLLGNDKTKLAQISVSPILSNLDIKMQKEGNKNNFNFAAASAQQNSEIDNFTIYENYYNSKNSKVEISQEEESLIADNFSNEEDVDKDLLENNFENTGFVLNDIFFDDEKI